MSHIFKASDISGKPSYAPYPKCQVFHFFKSVVCLYHNSIVPKPALLAWLRNPVEVGKPIMWDCLYRSYRETGMEDFGSHPRGGLFAY